jgi:hypothetical protein
MNSSRLKSYGSNLKRIAEADARDSQRQVIRSNNFKASLVDDPLRSGPDLVGTIESIRQRSSK